MRIVNKNKNKNMKKSEGSVPLRFLSSTDKTFYNTLELWLDGQREILVLIRYSRAAGAKSFEFFSVLATLLERLGQLPPCTSIIAFRQFQLPLRDVVNDEFISNCLSKIPNGSEFLLVETVPRKAGQTSWFHEVAGETHSELREALEVSRDRPVAVGLYPPWQEDSADVISAVVPDEHGEVKLGIY
jgi:hypothetical protein